VGRELRDRVIQLLPSTRVDHTGEPGGILVEERVYCAQ
jgi:hypothetical protein